MLDGSQKLALECSLGVFRCYMSVIYRPLTTHFWADFYLLLVCVDISSRVLCVQTGRASPDTVFLYRES